MPVGKSRLYAGHVKPRELAAAVTARPRGPVGLYLPRDRGGASTATCDDLRDDRYV